MGFLMPKQKQNKVVNQPVPDPTDIAEQDAIGSNRKAEDESLFGTTTPDLRTNRTATPQGVETSGSGLKLM